MSNIVTFTGGLPLMRIRIACLLLLLAPVIAAADSPWRLGAAT